VETGVHLYKEKERLDALVLKLVTCKNKKRNSMKFRIKKKIFRAENKISSISFLYNSRWAFAIILDIL